MTNKEKLELSENVMMALTDDLENLRESADRVRVLISTLARAHGIAPVEPFRPLSA